MLATTSDVFTWFLGIEIRSTGICVKRFYTLIHLAGYGLCIFRQVVALQREEAEKEALL